MEKRKLTQEFEISAIGLGCMGMSEFYGPRDDAVSLTVLHKATELGIDFFDTADMYGPYHNEELLGQFLKSSQHSVKIATKFGIRRNPGEYARTIDNSPTYLQTACEASLVRLGVEQIDLYYVHRVNPDQPIEETMGALADLVQAGKIARIGLSEVSAETLRRAHAVHPITALQTEYSLWSRDVEASILPTCRELGIGFVPYSPLGRGFLTGRFQPDTQFGAGDFRGALPRFQDDAMRQNVKIVDIVQRVAQAKGCTAGQVALAWLLAQGSDIVPIPGTKTERYLSENAAAVSVQLTPEDMRTLDASLKQTPVAGDRYTAEGMKGLEA